MRELTEQIWSLAGRENFTEITAGALTNLQDVVRLADNQNCGGILLRLVEKLDQDAQAQLGEILTKMEASKRGKFILTSASFERVNPELLKPLCKIRFTNKAATPATVNPANETSSDLSEKVSREVTEVETASENRKGKFRKFAEGFPTQQQRNYCRIAALLNSVLFGLLLIVSAAGAVAFIGLMIGLSQEQIFGILLTLTLTLMNKLKKSGF